ncbi:MAG TPA: YfiR family protein [Rhodanobacteraceae bacterium]|nr:YfiR family protein [Rhodanobacteraceae bacterium]
MAVLAAGRCIRCGWWLALAVLLSVPVAAVPIHAKVRDYQVKAVFLFNFTQFVGWPSGAFGDSQEPIVIGVLGDDPFGAYLDETVRGERVDSRSLVVRRYRDTADLDAAGCQVLFISESEAGRLEQDVARLRDRSILTVSDLDGFVDRGGMIQFVTENNRVKLRINADAAKAAGLTISSKLLRVAD